MSTSGPIDVLLWDCDGVLQHGRQDWRAALNSAAGQGFARRVYEAELPALRGEDTLHTVLTDLLARERRRSGQAPVSLTFLFELWEQFDLDQEALDVLAAVRELGVRSLLATNQHDHRAQWMRRVCRYDERVDGSYYSSEVGAMKPDPAFFEHILSDLALPAERVGFIDDMSANVETAAALGIRAVLHDPAAGASGLVTGLSHLVPGLSARLPGLSPR